MRLSVSNTPQSQSLPGATNHANINLTMSSITQSLLLGNLRKPPLDSLPIWSAQKWEVPNCETDVGPWQPILALVACPTPITTNQVSPTWRQPNQLSLLKIQMTWIAPPLPTHWMRSIVVLSRVWITP